MLTQVDLGVLDQVVVDGFESEVMATAFHLIEDLQDRAETCTDTDTADRSMDLSVDDSGLSCGMTYYYKVLAYNSEGSSDKSEAAMGSTEDCDPTDPRTRLPRVVPANHQSC